MLAFAALLLVLGFGKLSSQPSVAIGQELCCEDSSVLLGVEVSGFNNVGSITIFIQIDTLLVDYVALVNPNALLGNNIVVNFQTYHSRIAISWFSLVGISIAEGTLFDLQLNYHQGDAGLNFVDCEIADSDGNILEGVTYQNGSLLPSLEIAAHPQSQSINEGEQVQFDIALQNAGAQEYCWQEFKGVEWNDLSDDETYSGVFTSALAIENVPLDFNGFQYRCRITYTDCSAFSDAATLSVSPLAVLNNLETGLSKISIFPNPVTDGSFNYQIESAAIDNRVRLVNLSGELVFEHLLQSPSGTINAENLGSGMYFLQISNCEFTTFVKFLKK
jgi:hypothetical protein